MEDSRLISEPIIEEGREFDPKKASYFVPVQAIDYINVDWEQIEHTTLGRRLNEYFNQLKADRKLLQNKIKLLTQSNEVELFEQAEYIKKTLKNAYQEELKINMAQFQHESKHLRQQFYVASANAQQFDSMLYKFSKTIMEYEQILMELKKNL